jgi:hypothetical protein
LPATLIPAKPFEDEHPDGWPFVIVKQALDAADFLSSPLTFGSYYRRKAQAALGAISNLRRVRKQRI